LGNLIDAVWLSGVVIDTESRPRPAILKPTRQEYAKVSYDIFRKQRR